MRLAGDSKTRGGLCLNGRSLQIKRLPCYGFLGSGYGADCLKRPNATSHSFERLVAESAYELLEAIGHEAAGRNRAKSSLAGDDRILDIDGRDAQSLTNGFLFGLQDAAEPESWCIFEEIDASPGVFAWKLRLREADNPAFIGACCRCFLGRAASPNEITEIAARLGQRKLLRRDLVRTLMLADDADAFGRFLVVAAPSVLADAVAPDGGIERNFPRLRIRT